MLSLSLGYVYSQVLNESSTLKLMPNNVGWKTCHKFQHLSTVSQCPLYGVGMRQPTIPALLRTPPHWLPVSPSMSSDFTGTYSGQRALLSRPFRALL